MKMWGELLSLPLNYQGLMMTDATKTLKKMRIKIKKNAHVHAVSMAQYAQDAKTCKEPWKKWEVNYENSPMWYPCTMHPDWNEGHSYRRAPSTQVQVGDKTYQVPTQYLESLEEELVFVYGAVLKKD